MIKERDSFLCRSSLGTFEAVAIYFNCPSFKSNKNTSAILEESDICSNALSLLSVQLPNLMFLPGKLLA